MEYYDLLSNCANSMNLEYDRDKHEKFIKYMRLVQEWNTKINFLTSSDEQHFI